MTGKRGIVLERIIDIGYTDIKGEKWIALKGSDIPIEKGNNVIVIERKGLTLIVMPEGKKMQNECSRLKEILEAQIDIIERHVDNHKWFTHIADRNEAIRDFIEKYGFIMREFFCSRICEERFTCEIASQYHPK